MFLHNWALKKLKVTKQLFIRLTSYTKMRWLSLLLCLNVCSRQPSKKLNVQNPFIICNCTLIHLDMFTFLLNLLKPLNRADSALLTVTRSNSDFKPYELSALQFEHSTWPFQLLNGIFTHFIRGSHAAVTNEQDKTGLTQLCN